MVGAVGILLPNASVTLRAEALVVAILVFVIAQKARVPMSLNMSLVGLLAGISVATNTTGNTGFLQLVVFMWIVAPIAAFTLAFLLIRALALDPPTNLWQRLQAYKILLIVLSFSSAYVLGANTLGLVVATGGFDWITVAAAIGAIFVGSFFFGEGAIQRVSEEFYLMRYANATTTLVTSTILVEIATFFHIPLSNTQATAVAVFGTGVSYKTKLFSMKPFLTVVAAWIVAPLLSFAIGLLVG
jgi:PiT family inorganic phosphate transporter